MRSLLSIAVVALFAPACAKPLDQLLPFACAGDGTCPDGYTCADYKCVAVELDGLCGAPPDGIIDACVTLSPGRDILCQQLDNTRRTGICELTCSASSACPVGHSCSDPTSGICLALPDSGCPAGTQPGMAPGPAGTGMMLCIPDDAPVADGPCSTTNSCHMRDGSSALSCIAGTCVPPCSANGCDADRTCKVGGCFLGCATGTCPLESTCEPLDASGSGMNGCFGGTAPGDRCSTDQECEALGGPGSMCSNTTSFGMVCLTPCDPSTPEQCPSGTQCQTLTNKAGTYCQPLDTSL